MKIPSTSVGVMTLYTASNKSHPVRPQIKTTETKAPMTLDLPHPYEN